MTGNSVTELAATPQCDSGDGWQAGKDSCLKQSASEQVSGCLAHDKSISKFQSASQNIPNEPAATTQCNSRNGCQAGEDSCLKQSASEQVSVSLANGNSISEFQSASENIPNEPAARTQCDSGNGCQTGEGSCLKPSALEQVSGCLANDKSVNECQLASRSIQIELGATPQCDSGNGCQTREGSCLKQSVSGQVSGCSANDKSIKEFQQASLNVQNELAVTAECDSGNGCQTGEDSCVKQSASEQVSSFSANDKTTDEFQPASQIIQNEQAATPQCDSGNNCQTGEGSCPKQNASEQVSGCLFNDKSINKFQPASQNNQNDPVEVNDAVINFLDKDQMQSVPAQVTMSTGNEQLDPPSGDVAKSSSFDCLERKSKKETHARAVRHRKKLTSKSLKKKYMLRSLGSNDRALRSKTREKTKAPESNTNLVNARNDGEKSRSGRKKKKKKSQGGGMADEFSRIRAHLKYLLNRVSYEQSLIDAYSAEGWKGNSMDKIRPEKELQRAKSEILRRKLKMRDLFRHLDTLCAEGRLPESLFDSEGEIDSEDIFCAKCGSKDLPTDNDIILCDGPCDRGFHQFCLEPPLFTENIPPDNESWLCPGCDCKDDCIELLNESFGTSLSISDTWERIFPEAAATAGNNVGLPSEDSDDDDDDYNPDAPEDKEMKRDESSSDESEYASASEKLDDPHKGDQYLGLPSDDSEDDDYDPNSPNLDKKVTEESSSSDFTSDSEDLETTIKDSMLSGQDEDPVSASLNDIKQFKGSGRQKFKAGKRQTLANELSSLLESDPGQEGSASISGRRQVERLDYKKLYDETYKNVKSDTSDDEDWTGTATARRRKKLSTKVTPASPNGKASSGDHLQEKSARTPKRNTSQKKVENTPNTPPEGSRKSSSSDKKPGSSTYKRLGEAVVQRLNKSFEENQYPDRATKENLAQELGLTFQQVDKWFGNTRWSFRHPSHTKASTDRNDALEQPPCSKAENQESLGVEKNRGEKSKSSSCRKRKRESDPEASDAKLDVESAATQPQAGSSGVHKWPRGHKMRKRRR